MEEKEAALTESGNGKIQLQQIFTESGFQVERQPTFGIVEKVSQQGEQIVGRIGLRQGLTGCFASFSRFRQS